VGGENWKTGGGGKKGGVHRKGRISNARRRGAVRASLIGQLGKESDYFEFRKRLKARKGSRRTEKKSGQKRGEGFMKLRVLRRCKTSVGWGELRAS